ncbi:hypothetical protein OG333_37165 (plasmid) [Streptomyces anulatus]|uniref:hypothetical protein n=1 Tax=Streptomyces anulatus TaxID=1892 RepID=UPI002F90A283|nr:hypothetical protein OG333_37165 [Streptomyces anulatus]
MQQSLAPLPDQNRAGQAVQPAAPGDWRKVFTEGRGVAEMKIKTGDGKASGEYLVGRVGG